MEFLNEITEKKNRIKKTEPKSNRHSWCDGCDRNVIRTGEKCKVCGYIEETKHRKP